MSGNIMPLIVHVAILDLVEIHQFGAASYCSFFLKKLVSSRVSIRPHFRYLSTLKAHMTRSPAVKPHELVVPCWKKNAKGNSTSSAEDP